MAGGAFKVAFHMAWKGSSGSLCARFIIDLIVARVSP
jgi:hypothetical protein